jgi:hypothetical protein
MEWDLWELERVKRGNIRWGERIQELVSFIIQDHVVVDRIDFYAKNDTNKTVKK